MARSRYRKFIEKWSTIRWLHLITGNYGSVSPTIIIGFDLCWPSSGVAERSSALAAGSTFQTDPLPQWLAQLLCRPGVRPVHPCVPPQAATPVDAGATPPVTASPIQLEATGAHDRNPVATRLHPPPMAGPAVYRQAPEVGAGWFSDHVRICAGGAQQCAFLPQQGEGLGNDPSYPAEIGRRREYIL